MGIKETAGYGQWYNHFPCPAAVLYQMTRHYCQIIAGKLFCFAKLHFTVAIINQQYRDTYEQTKEFSGFFYPWLFRFHCLCNILRPMLRYPVYYTIFCKEQVNGISQVYEDTCPVPLRIKTFPGSLPAKIGSIKVYGHPHIRIGIVVL